MPRSLSIRMTLLIGLISSLIMCSSAKRTLPSELKPVLKAKKLEGSRLMYLETRITIPESWNYLLEKEDQAIAVFESKDSTVKGKLYVYPKSNLSLKTLFQKYLLAKEDIRFSWMKEVQMGSREAWIVKGEIESVEDFEKGKKVYHTVYLSLIAYKEKIYELILLGKDKNNDLEKEAVQIIIGIRQKQGGVKNYRERYGIRIYGQEDWNQRSTQRSQVINWSHKRMAIIVSVSLVKKMKNSKDFKEQVKRNINLYKINLTDAGVQYDFELRKTKVTSKKKLAIIFHAVGVRKKKKIAIRKYYFAHKNYLYEMEILYESKDWKEGISKEVRKVLKAIQFTR